MRPSWGVRLAGVLVLALLIRVAFVWRLGTLLGGDDAIVGLMALKIAAGESFPLVFWEAHYGGTLPSYLGAAAFLLFGPTPAVLRVATLPLELVGIAALVAAARLLWGATPALVGGLWLAAGPPMVFVFGLQALAYSEVLALGGLTLWLVARLHAEERPGAGRWWGLGAAAGFGTYSSFFILPLFLGALWTLRRAGVVPDARARAALAAGFLVGVSPLVVYNVLVPGATALRLGSRILEVSTSEVTRAPSVGGLLGEKALGYGARLARYPLRLATNLPAALGLPGWATAVAALLVVAAAARAASRRAGFGGSLLARCGLATLLFVWLSGLDAPRHLYPFYLLAPLGLAALWASTTGWTRRLLATGLLVVLASNVAGTARAAGVPEPDIAALAAALAPRGVAFVYSDYAIAYPLVFLTRERIVASPVAGPTNVERYPPYTRAVAAAPRPSYVFLAGTEPSHVFAREMARAGRTFTRETLGEFDLYVPDAHVDPLALALVRKY